MCDVSTERLSTLSTSLNTLIENSAPVLRHCRLLLFFLQVIVVDIDDQKVVKKVGDEQSILPIHLIKGLKNALQLAHSSEIQTNNLLACEAFTRLFVELIGHYRRFIISSNLDRIRRKTFQVS